MSEEILQPAQPQIRSNVLTRRTSLAIRHRIMRDYFFLGPCVTPAGYSLAIAPPQDERIHITHAEIRRDAGIVLSEIIWRELRHTGLWRCAHNERRGTRRGEKGEGQEGWNEGEWKGPVCKVRRETRCRFNITVFPLSLSPALAYSPLPAIWLSVISLSTRTSSRYSSSEERGR